MARTSRPSRRPSGRTSPRPTSRSSSRRSAKRPRRPRRCSTARTRRRRRSSRASSTSSRSRSSRTSKAFRGKARRSASSSSSGCRRSATSATRSTATSRPMDTPQVVDILETIARILEVQDENPFKVRAYRNGARALESLPTDLKTLIEQKKLGEVPGIGKALEEKITQLVTTGRMDYYEELRREVPAGVIEMLAIPSFGPKKARAVWKELGVDSLDALRRAAEGH